MKHTAMKLQEKLGFYLFTGHRYFSLLQLTGVNELVIQGHPIVHIADISVIGWPFLRKKSVLWFSRRSIQLFQLTLSELKASSLRENTEKNLHNSVVISRSSRSKL